MAAASPVVSRCTNCGQEYDAALALRECRACYQPLGYWCKRDSEASGSWLPGPVCTQCERREERNRRRREQRRRKKESVSTEVTLFDTAPGAPSPSTNKGKNARSGSENDIGPAPQGEKRKMAPPPPVHSPRIATVHAVGVVRRCTNCGTEYAPAAESIECSVCFGNLGWWCRTHSATGGAWLSGESCPLCLSAPPPIPPRTRPPILPEAALRSSGGFPKAPAPAAAREPYPGPMTKALTFLYALVFLMALVSTSLMEADGKVLTGAVGAGAAAFAFRFRAKPVLIILGVLAAGAGTLWLYTRDPLAALVFALASLMAARMQRARVLAVGACYLSVLYAFVAEPVFGVLGVSTPTLPLELRTPRSVETPAKEKTVPSDTPLSMPSVDRASPDADILPTRLSPPRVLPGHMGPAYAVTYLPGGEAALSLGHDNTLRTWELRTGRARQELAMSPATAALLYRYSPEGDLLAEVRAVNPHSVLVWNSRTNQLVHTLMLSSPASSLGFSPHGVTLAVGTATGDIEVFDISSSRRLHRIERAVGGPITAVDLSGSLPLLAAAGPRGIGIWDLSKLAADNGRPAVRLGGAGANRAVAIQFTSSGRTLMVVGVEDNVSADLSVSYWNTASGRMLKKVPPGKTYPASACAIRADGRQFTCASRSDLPGDSRLYVYDLTGP